jgi:type IV pilus assembly protein PilA
MKLNKGFTLIELLVVIAIIGILSSVVLASLTTARSRGQIAAVQSQLSNMRAQAELYYSTTGNNSYGTASGATTDCSAGGVFTGTNGLSALIAGVKSNGATVTCSNPGGTSWSVEGAFSGVNYCVDSTGYSGTSTKATADGACL